MVESYAQQPKQSTTAGYRPLAHAGFGEIKENTLYAYLGVAAGIGLLLGVGIAILVGQAHVAAAPRVAPEASVHASGLSALPASYTGPAPSVLSAVDNRKKVDAASPLFPTASDESGKKLGTTRKRHSLFKLWPWKKSPGKRKPYISPNELPAPATTALELATAAAAAGPFVLGIQGDATVASYDVASGTIETYEGSTFVLDRAAAGNGAIAWEDFPFHVHYRCDQGGNCAMLHAGSTASARLAR